MYGTVQTRSRTVGSKEANATVPAPKLEQFCPYLPDPAERLIDSAVDGCLDLRLPAVLSDSSASRSLTSSPHRFGQLIFGNESLDEEEHRRCQNSTIQRAKSRSMRSRASRELPLRPSRASARCKINSQSYAGGGADGRGVASTHLPRHQIHCQASLRSWRTWLDQAQAYVELSSALFATKACDCKYRARAPGLTPACGSVAPTTTPRAARRALTSAGNPWPLLLSGSWSLLVKRLFELVDSRMPRS